MKNLLIILLSLFFIDKNASAQTYKEGNIFGFTVNVGSSSFANAFSWSHYHQFGKKNRIKIGYGIRLTNFFGSDLDYITAPAKYTSGKESIAALASETILANLDTVSFASSQVNFLNTGIYLAYTLPFLKNKLDFGINIDVLGFSFGAKQVGLYKNNTVTAKPTGFNILLISDSDMGSLNSEWYLRYHVSEKWALKAGYEFLFTEYTTDSKIQGFPNSTDTNDRFRLKSPMIMIGIQFYPFKK